MSEDEMDDAANVVRAFLQQVTPSPTEAMLVCMIAAAQFSVDGPGDNERAALKMETAMNSIVRGVREGSYEVRRLNS